MITEFEGDLPEREGCGISPELRAAPRHAPREAVAGAEKRSLAKSRFRDVKETFGPAASGFRCGERAFSEIAGGGLARGAGCAIFDLLIRKKVRIVRAFLLVMTFVFYSPVRPA